MLWGLKNIFRLLIQVVIESDINTKVCIHQDRIDRW